ncbi:probable WRKY transcription factor 40 [Cornus florida]|uniref:probable WRKY transcription factor 40 n=1 Tax=Cornus florida TaxID=4283 RepID=UPI0028987687|nr:probable WRKY transcription factor 40 [Cornus florida]
MDYSTCVDTSLSINLTAVNPSRHIDETPESGTHEHLFPILNRKSQYDQGDFVGLEGKLAEKQEVNLLVEELNRVIFENRRLTEMLTIVREKYNALQSHFMDLTSNKSDSELVRLGKRKADDEDCGYYICTNNEDAENSCGTKEGSCKMPKESFKTNTSRVCVKTDYESVKSLTVKDGHRWRKYGQKVTRDNSSPRAYYKCSFAPSCPVKKKVQRSAEDQSVLVATYVGEHNHHHHPFQAELSLSTNQCVKPGSIPCSTSLTSSSSTKTLDFIKPGLCGIAKNSTTDIEAPVHEQFFLQQIGSSMTRDSSFMRSGLTKVINPGRTLEQNGIEY